MLSLRGPTFKKNTLKYDNNLLLPPLQHNLKLLFLALFQHHLFSFIAQGHFIWVKTKLPELSYTHVYDQVVIQNKPGRSECQKQVTRFRVNIQFNLYFYFLEVIILTHHAKWCLDEWIASMFLYSPTFAHFNISKHRKKNNFEIAIFETFKKQLTATLPTPFLYI